MSCKAGQRRSACIPGRILIEFAAFSGTEKVFTLLQLKFTASRWLEGAAEFATCISLAVLLTAPAGHRLRMEIMAGQEASTVVPRFNLWTLWWNTNRISEGWSGYWDAPIFAPSDGAFAFSEPQPLTGLIGWILCSITPNLNVVYNLVLSLFLTLNGWFAIRLLRSMRLHRFAVWSGGVMMLALPFIHWQLGVLQLCAMWPALWTCEVLIRNCHSPRPIAGEKVALATAVGFFTCQYYFVMLAIVLPCAGMLLFRLTKLRQLLFRGVPSFVLVLLILVVPCAWTQGRILQDSAMSQPRDQLDQLSATIAGYLHTPWRQWFPPPGILNAGNLGWQLSPGTGKLLVAVAGVCYGLWHRGRRRVTAFWLVWGGVAMFFSLGTRVSVLDVNAIEFLADYVPGYQYFRSPFRFSLFVQVASVVLAAQGIHASAVGCRRVCDRGRTWSARSRSCASWLMMAALGAILCLEAWPPAPRWVSTSFAEPAPAWVRWIDEHTKRDVVLAHLPFPHDTRVSAFEETLDGMLWQTRHNRRLVNGYAGLFPQPFRHLMQEAQSFPNTASLDALRQSYVEYCVVSADMLKATRESPAVANGELNEVFLDEELGVAIFVLRARHP